MNDLTPFERRLTTVLGTIADQIDTDVDAVAMTRFAAAASTTRGAGLQGVVSRRWNLATVLLVLGLAATLVTGLVIGAGGLRQGPIVASSPTPGPTVGTPGKIVARFGDLFVGWVFVYADGRVVEHFDLKPPTRRYSIEERRLTPAGVALIADGVVHPREILLAEGASLPDEAWADSESEPPTQYVPSLYAACWFMQGVEVTSSRVLDLLPAGAQAPLRAHARTYDDVVSFYVKGDLYAAYASWTERNPTSCSELPPEAARSVALALSAAGFDGWPLSAGVEYGDDWADFLSPGADFGIMSIDARSAGMSVAEVPSPLTRVYVAFVPILPHGSWVAWGG